jgi:hypothetical protein
MNNRDFHFCAISKITMTHVLGAPKSTLKSVDMRLEVSKNLDKSMYIDFKGLPKKDALKPIANAFVHGIIANIRHGAQKGWWSEGEHMQYVIDELQRAFVAQGSDPGESTMEY